MNALNAAHRMQMIEKFETLTMGEYEALVSVNEQLRQRVAKLERFHELDTKQIAYLFEERDVLKQQRDKLLDTLIYAASCLGTNGCDPIDLVIASVKELK